MDPKDNSKKDQDPSGQTPNGQQEPHHDPRQAGAPESAAAAGAGNDLETQLLQATARAEEYEDAYLRAQAEMQNIRRRSQEDVSKAHKFAIEGFAESLVPVADSLEAALKADAANPQAMRDGMELTLKQLMAAFEKGKLVAIDPVGEKFDPNRHQAISMVPAGAGQAPNTVVTVLQKGFLLSDRVLRPALVIVAQA